MSFARTFTYPTAPPGETVLYVLPTPQGFVIRPALVVQAHEGGVLDVVVLTLGAVDGMPAAYPRLGVAYADEMDRVGNSWHGRHP